MVRALSNLPIQSLRIFRVPSYKTEHVLDGYLEVNSGYGLSYDMNCNGTWLL